MRLFRKRVVIPSALICTLAILYFLLKLLLASDYVTSSVVGSLSRKFNCNVKIEGASLSLNRLTITGLTLSYRKARAIHEVARIRTMIVHFSPGPFFNKGAFERIELSDVTLTIERDSEGWLTFGRIVEPRATLATKSFPIEIHRMRIFVENKIIPVKSATVKVTSAWPRVDVELAEAAIHDGKATGRAWFAMEEDPRLDASLSASGIALQNPSLPAGDVRLKGTVSCHFLFGGTASSRFLMREGSWLRAKGVSVGFGEESPVFETSFVALTLARRESKTKRAEVKVHLGTTLLNVTPWIHSRDTPEHLIVRQKIEGLFRGCPGFLASMTGADVRLVYETMSLPLDSFSGDVLSRGNIVAFKNVKAAIGRSGIDTSWRRQGSGMALNYDGRLVVRDVDMARLLSGTSLRDRKVGGVLSGELRFAQAPAAGGGPKGTGSLRIAKAKLWALPILEAVEHEAKLHPRKGSASPELRTTVALDKDMFHFTRIDFRDGNVAITGAGDIYHSGEVDLRLKVTSKEPHQKNVPVIDDFGALFADAFGTKHSSVHITGTFTSPVAASTTDRAVEKK